MENIKLDRNGGAQMDTKSAHEFAETLINVVKTQTGFAHYIKQSNGVVVIEFVGGK